MQLALITDLHFGVRNDSIDFLDANKRFLDKIFFPYLREHNIKTVICLGDLLDRRKFINYYTAMRLREDFLQPMFDPMEYHPYEFYWILGNHDLYYKHSLEVSPAYELARDYSINIIDKPTDFKFGNLDVLMVPWITDDNKVSCHYAIQNSNAPVLMGHLEIQGFEMFKGVPSNVGEDKQLFGKFDRVFTGHFHHRHSRGNIFYLGAMGDYSWADYGDSRGFHVFDTETKELTFIENSYTMFAKIYYDDSGEHSVIPRDGFDSLTGKLVKVIIHRQCNPDQFDWFYTQLEAAKPLKIQTVRETETQNFVVNAASIADKDTLTVIRDCINMSNTSVNTEKLDRLFVDLYREAQDVE